MYFRSTNADHISELSQVLASVFSSQVVFVKSSRFQAESFVPP